MRGLFTSCWLCMAVLIAAGCEKSAPAVAPPAPTVVIVTQPVSKQITDYSEFTGNTTAYNTVDVRARVKGFLKSMKFTEGAQVKEGDLLYEIDPDQFQADVDRAKATLQGAQARLEKAKADLAIKQEMLKGNAASQLDVLQAQASVDTSTADVASSKADLTLAEINLGYTKVYAPISGRIADTQVDVGNLVGADGNTLLTSIVQWQPMYVYFDADEGTMQRYKDRIKAKDIELPDVMKAKIPVELALGDSGDFRYHGVIDFVDNTVDTSTGTIRIRGVLANADRMLAPGYFARVRVPDGEPYRAMLVPERAIGVDQGEKFMLVVNDKNQVEYRAVDVGTKQGRMRVIKKGLSPGEWYIVEGLLRTRPGATVNPTRQPISELELDASSAPTTKPEAK